MNRSRYVTDIKDLVIQTLANGSEIKAKAVGGDALSCFQMGMIHMFGINTPIEFKEASKYFGYQSLSDDPDAKRLLGFISECEGYYSEAFKRYANAADAKGSDKKDYITKVYEERNNLIGYFNKIGLPNDVLNKDISQILNEYIGGGHSKIDACIKLANICNDEPLCLEVAQNYFSIGDYYSAKKWLLKGNIDSSNHLYIYVKERLMEVEDAIKTSRDLEVIDINGDSLVEKQNVSSITVIDNLNNININTCKQDWQESVSQVVESIKRVLEEEERIRLQRIQEEEAERQRKLQEEEDMRQRRLQEEEAARQKELQEEQTSLEKPQEEDTARILSHNEDYSNLQIKPSGEILKAWADNTGCLAAKPFDGMFNNTWDTKNSTMNELFTDNFTSKLGIYIHSNIVTNRQSDQTCKIMLKLSPLGVGNHIEGTVSLTPNYNNGEWNDFQINISSFQFGLKKDGRYNYEASMSLYDNMNNLLDTKKIEITIDYIHHTFKDDEIIVVK
jgi:hypothetical protein